MPTAAVVIFLSARGPAPAASFDPPATSVRVGNRIEVLATEKNSFHVPVFLRHAGDSNAVHIGLDYDDLVLEFAESVAIGGGLSEMPWKLTHARERARIDLWALFDPERGGREAEVLFLELEFRLQRPIQVGVSYGDRISAAIDLDEKATHFLRTVDQAPIRPAVLQDGSVTVYLRDALEVGSARILPRRQVFRLPVFATHLESERGAFLMGVDYDEQFLSLLGIEAASPLLEKTRLHSDSLGGRGEKAWVEARFVSGEFPPLLREHLIDLVFEYRPESGIPPGQILRVTPIPASDMAGGEGGTAEVETRDGELFVSAQPFIRGDANGSGEVEMIDALLILSGHVFQSLPDAELSDCLDALDADANGRVEITDAILVLDYLFLGGSPPALPFPEPGLPPPNVPHLGCSSEEPEFEALALTSSR